MVVVAYGLILPRKVLAIPGLGCWNVHASLLPRWRGAAPIQRAILAGDTESGVDLMQMEAGLDTGPVLVERRTPIAPDETGGSLHDRLSALGADALAEGLRRTMAGEMLAPRAQSDDGVEYAHKLDKAEARLDFALPAIALERKVRAFNPWPGAFTELHQRKLKIFAASIVDQNGKPGEILQRENELIVATGKGALLLNEVQLEGKRRMSIAEFLRGRSRVAPL